VGSQILQRNGDLKVMAAIIETSGIRKILSYLGILDKPPDMASARFSGK
jgi:hypothetical protein